MKDIFGEAEASPELELFEKVGSLYEFDEALQDFRDYLAMGMSIDQAIEKAAANVIPATWIDSLGDQ